MTEVGSWTTKSYLDKARLCFSYAEESPSNGPDFSLWLLLGFEHLARSALAKVSPALVASPDSILDALGYERKTSDPKTVLFKTVVERLAVVIEPFTEDQKDASLRLAGLRNRELHTGEPVLVEHKLSVWIPDFYTLVTILCEHLEEPVDEMLGDNVATMSRKLLADSDAKYDGLVKKRVSEAKKFFAQLTADEVERRSSAIVGSG
jgi:hypothetical protein